MFDSGTTSALEAIEDPLILKKGLQLWLKREDQIDPTISGNKWRKLKYNFIKAQEEGFKKLLTFGGAYSNHIAATASAARKYGFQSIGIIRGDELHPNSNSTLQKAHSDGMELIFISREAYRRRNEAEWVKELQHKHNAWVVPEGGSNLLALEGIGEMVSEIVQPFDYILCPVGSGGTLAGIVSSIDTGQSVIGIATLKADRHLEDLVSDMLKSHKSEKKWQISHDYHFGGYAKFDHNLIEFINDFYARNQIPLDPIYTGKMMYGLYDLIAKDHFSKGSKIIAIHTGGLQGIPGINIKHNLKLKCI